MKVDVLHHKPTGPLITAPDGAQTGNFHLVRWFSGIAAFHENMQG
ncbi:MAG: hypothetical protein WCB11_30025 [Terriglobales bacterium]